LEATIKRIIISIFICIIFFTCGANQDIDLLSKIESASEKQILYINEGFTDNNYFASNVYCIKSTEHKNAYYVIAKINGLKNVKFDYGIWLISGDKNNPGMIQSVSDIASAYTPYPLSSKTKANATDSDAESKTLKIYVNNLK